MGNCSLEQTKTDGTTHQEQISLLLNLCNLCNLCNLWGIFFALNLWEFDQSNYPKYLLFLVVLFYQPQMAIVFEGVTNGFFHQASIQLLGMAGTEFA